MLKLLVALSLLAPDYGQIPKPPKKPQNCADECKLIKDSCGQGCEKTKDPKGRSSCDRTCKDVSKTCEDSCKERGRVDADYMKKHLKLPGQK